MNVAKPLFKGRQFSHLRTSQNFIEPQVHYRVHKSPALVSVLSQISLVHTTQSDL
jgi:hypothetical protein